MEKVKTILCVGMLMLGLVGAAPAHESPTAVVEISSLSLPPAENKPLVQMAILLDTSNSMDGLIDQAKTELWAIVNEFIFATRQGKPPELHVALYEYGKSTLASRGGYIRMIVPFTMDLDKISEELFALKTKGGDEYCGWVIQEATESLKWSNQPDDLKVIFIAGNEPFTQGPIDYEKACKAAISKGIVVNTIHCGSSSDGISGKWKDGALLADGRFLNINQNHKAVHIESPYDSEIEQLSLKLNDTYLAYGLMGEMGRERQVMQDRNARMASKAASGQRSASKASRNYRNETWDLVDALEQGTVKLEQVETKELPEEMQKMSEPEKKAYVEAKAKERNGIQEKVQRLNERRKKYVAEEARKQSKQVGTLGSAIIQAVREQAIKKNFKFEPPKETTEKKNQP